MGLQSPACGLVQTTRETGGFVSAVVSVDTSAFGRYISERAS